MVASLAGAPFYIGSVTPRSLLCRTMQISITNSAVVPAKSLELQSRGPKCRENVLLHANIAASVAICCTFHPRAL